MISEPLLNATLARFPHLTGDTPAIEPIEKGGSDRKFYRVIPASGESLTITYLSALGLLSNASPPYVHAGVDQWTDMLDTNMTRAASNVW